MAGLSYVRPLWNGNLRTPNGLALFFQQVEFLLEFRRQWNLWILVEVKNIVAELAGHGGELMLGELGDKLAIRVIGHFVHPGGGRFSNIKIYIRRRRAAGSLGRQNHSIPLDSCVEAVDKQFLRFRG